MDRPLSSLWFWLTLPLLVAAPAHAGNPPDRSELYQAVAIVTGTDMRDRPKGFARCLREVLVKVSGEPRLAGDSRVAGLAAHLATHPAPLIASFDYVDEMAGIPKKDDQGSYDRPHYLTVRFDPAQIDRELARLGEHPWRGERPRILPVLAVRGFKSSYLFSAEAAAAAQQRAAFASVAHDFAMTLQIPSASELAKWGVRLGRFPTPRIASSRHQAVVAGTLEFDPRLPGWVGAWRMRWRGVDYAWGIRGVNYDEAFRDIVRGIVRVASGHGGPG